MVGAGLNSANNHVEAEVVVRPTVLIETRLKIRRRRVIGKIHGAPFNIEDPVRRAPRDRGEDTAGSTGEIRATAQAQVGAQILPHGEDGEVIRSNIRWRRQTVCKVAARLIDCHEVEPSIGVDVHAGKGLVIQRE